MRITFEQSGGFAGLIRTKTIDTSTLSPPDAQQVQRLIDAADFFRLPDSIEADVQPDRFQYYITVEDGDRHHSVEISETNIPPTIRPLLEWLQNH